MNVTITFKNKVESYYTRADGSAALSKDVLELTADGSAAVLWSRLEFDRGGGDDGTKPRTERGFSREVLRLPPAAAVGPGGSLDEAQRSEMLRAIHRHGGNISAAARDLGIGRATFYRKMKALGRGEG